MGLGRSTSYITRKIWGSGGHGTAPRRAIPGLQARDERRGRGAGHLASADTFDTLWTWATCERTVGVASFDGGVVAVGGGMVKRTSSPGCAPSGTTMTTLRPAWLILSFCPGRAELGTVSVYFCAPKAPPGESPLEATEAGAPSTPGVAPPGETGSGSMGHTVAGLGGLRLKGAAICVPSHCATLGGAHACWIA